MYVMYVQYLRKKTRLIDSVTLTLNEVHLGNTEQRVHSLFYKSKQTTMPKLSLSRLTLNSFSFYLAKAYFLQEKGLVTTVISLC
jgi:hypothetical protein